MTASNKSTDWCNFGFVLDMSSWMSQNLVQLNPRSTAQREKLATKWNCPGLNPSQRTRNPGDILDFSGLTWDFATNLLFIISKIKLRCIYFSLWVTQREPNACFIFQQLGPPKSLKSVTMDPELCSTRYSCPRVRTAFACEFSNL